MTIKHEIIFSGLPCAAVDGQVSDKRELERVRVFGAGWDRGELLEQSPPCAVVVPGDGRQRKLIQIGPLDV